MSDKQEDFDKRVAELADSLKIRKASASKKLNHTGFSKKRAASLKVKR